MKETVALLLFVCCSIPTFYLAAKGRIPLKLTITLLAFSLFTGIAVSNYDVIHKIKWAGLEVETAEKEIRGFKESDPRCQ